MILLALTTDGRRDCIEQTIPSLLERVKGIDGPKLLFDDSGDQAYREWLTATFEPQGFWVMPIGPERVGQDRALQIVWKHLGREVYADHSYVFFCEDDFLFERDVDLDAMRSTLDARPYLAQMALLRQPWFPGEVKAGGIIERDPDEYTQVLGLPGEMLVGTCWWEHRLWFSLNPSLFRRDICKLERPIGKRHEWRFSRQLCEDPEVRFGLWGDGTPWCRHIGDQRVGHGY